MERRTLGEQIDDMEFDRQCDKRLSDAVTEAVEYEREECAKVADEKDNYWNTIAYDQRQAGKSDVDASARAGSAMTIAAAIRTRT